MDKKRDYKKIIRVLGNVVTVIAVFFICIKLYRMDIDLSILSGKRVALTLLLSFVFQFFLIILSSIPWLCIVNALSNKDLKLKEALPVFTKANLYKYIPGNVFQYVGRNSLAVEYRLNHLDVASATVIDTIIQLSFYSLLSIAMLGDSISSIAEKYIKDALLGLLIIVIVVSAIIITMVLIVGKRVREYTIRYRDSLSAGGFRKILKAVLITFFNCILSSVEYFICISVVFNDTVSLSKAIVLTGAYLFAWLIGFVTPGAPGGIGVREAVMLLVCSAADEELVIAFVLLMRIGSIVADIIAWIAGEFLKTSLKASTGKV